MVREFVADIEEKLDQYPALGCELVLALTPARPMEIADRLEPALPSGWELRSLYHREMNDGQTLHFHRIFTNNDRVPVDVLLEFGDRYQQIDDQLKIERAREAAPEAFEDALEDFGRSEALEMFGNIGGTGARLVQVVANTREVHEGVTAEALLRVNVDFVGTAEEFHRNFIQEPWLGTFIRVDRVGESEYLIGGGLLHNLFEIEQVTDFLESGMGADPTEAAVVCRVVEAEGDLV